MIEEKHIPDGGKERTDDGIHGLRREDRRRFVGQMLFGKLSTRSARRAAEQRERRERRKEERIAKRKRSKNG
jgi:hypothetical protein